MAIDPMNVNNANSNNSQLKPEETIQDTNSLSFLFWEPFPKRVGGSDIGKRMLSNKASHQYYSPFEIANGLKVSFSDTTTSVIESEKFQEYLNAIDENKVTEVYNLFCNTSLINLIADDVMSSVECRKEAILKIYDLTAMRYGITDPEHRENFIREMNTQFKKMGYMVKCEKLDQIIKDMSKV